MGETVNTGGPSGADLVEVAFAGDLGEAEMIQGLLESGGISSLLQPTGIDGRAIGSGLLPPGGPQRVAVHADQADAARRMLAETLVEAEPEVEIEELANAGHLERAAGRGPRNDGLVGAYARIWLWSLAAFSVAFGLFLLLRVV
jgi:hypothetical protein